MQKHIIRIVIVMLAFFLLLSSQNVQAKTDWNQFSQNIEKALKSDNLGLQRSAMQLVVKYGDRLKVKGALADVLKLYKSNSEEKIKDLALLTIFRMDRKKAMELIKEDEETDFKAFIDKRMDMYLSMN